MSMPDKASVALCWYGSSPQKEIFRQPSFLYALSSAFRSTPFGLPVTECLSWVILLERVLMTELG